MTAYGTEIDGEYRHAFRTVSMLGDLEPAPGAPDGDRLAARV